MGRSDALRSGDVAPQPTDGGEPLNRYLTYARLDRRADLLSRAAQAAKAASYRVALNARPPARVTAAKISAAALTAADARDIALQAYNTRRAAVATGGWIVLALAIVGMIAVAIAETGDLASGAFLAEMALMLAALVGVGLAVNGRVFGAAIDARNRVSLSKLQMLMWTVLAVASLTALLSAWLHAPGVITPMDPPAAIASLAKSPPAATNAPTARATSSTTTATTGTVTATGGTPQTQNAGQTSKPPLIPPELLLAMGIAVTSFVATPLLLSLKSAETPTDQAVNTLQSARVTDLANQGKVDARTDPAEAGFADIFHGDEVGNANSVDVSKVQQIFITLLLLGLYVGAVFQALAQQHGLIAGLPAMNDDFVKLMAISHATYLGYKAAPKTSSATGP